MIASTRGELNKSVLIYAPFGRDADTLAAVVSQTDIKPLICTSPQMLCGAITQEGMAILATEEALGPAAEQITSCLQKQPTWSDIPLIMLSGSRGRVGTQERWEYLMRFGNLTVLERPLASPALLMALKAAYRARSWQYVVRDQMEQLASQAADLEKRVDERTKALRNEVVERERIEKALHEAQRLEAIGRLTGGVAHDFNNLLQIISVSSALLRHAGSDETRTARIIVSIEQAVERASNLTQQLLAFGRRQTLSSHVLDLRMHLYQIKDLLQQSLREKIVLEFDFSSELMQVKADTTQLDVSLLNLVLNAKDAMPEGGTVTVSMHKLAMPSAEVPDDIDLSGDFVCLSVADTGPGMPKEVLEHAFEPFFTTKQIGAGSGMGLSQVYGFAKQSGGHAWIATGSNGTCVSVLLPCSLLGETADNVHYPESTAGIEQNLSGVRILYVEDDKEVAEVSMELLKDFGCIVTWACNASEALANDMSGIDVVFSDVLMPGTMDGIDMSREIIKRHPHLPIVLASGFVMSPERLESMEVTLLKKPYTTQELQRTLLACLFSK